MDIENMLNKIQQVEHGFQHIIDATDEILSSYSKKECFELALKLFCSNTMPIKSECWQQQCWGDWQQRITMHFAF